MKLISNLCRALVLGVLAQALAGQSCLTTLYTSNNGGAAGGAVYFDLNVSAGVLIGSIDLNTSAAVNTPVGVQVYTCPTTHVGNEANAAAWTLVGNDNGTTVSAGLNLPTTMTMSTPINLPPGSYGIALVGVGMAHRYTNGNGTNQSYTDPFLTMTLGAASNVPFSGTPFTPRVWNGSICYSPATGQYPNFSGTPTSGSSPLLVNFTDQSFTSAAGGILAWRWDVDGDNNDDYFTQNPSHTYTAGGSFNVRLTIVDGTFGQGSITKNAYIQVDFIDASFTYQLLAPGLYAFTDTSSGNPTAWAWDFNGDGIPDANTQNAAWQFGSGCGIFNVSLVASNAYSSDSATATIFQGVLDIPPFNRTYSSTGATRGYWFQAPVDFSIASVQVPDEAGAGVQAVAVYNLGQAPPAYSGSIPATPEFFSAGLPSNQVLETAVSFAANDFVGILGACGTTTMNNSYGPVGAYPSSVLGQPVLLTRLLTQFNIATTLGVNAVSNEAAYEPSRIWACITNALAWTYGVSSGSGNPVADPTMRATKLPILGKTAELTIEQSDAGAVGYVLFGIGRQSLPTPYGNLQILSIIDSALVASPMAVGLNTFSFVIPNIPALDGFGPINWQNVNFVPGSPNVFSMSNGVEWFLGT